MSVTTDADVLALFEQESAERLGILGELLLRLENEGAEPELVASLFREAHTLKGAAVVVGLEEIGAAAHALEEVLADVRSGVLDITAELLDELFAKLDQLSELAGVPGVGRDGNDEQTAQEPTVRAPQTPRRSPAVDDDATPSPLAHPTTRRESARVAVDRLDDLVRLAGE
ncbi:MAG: two-component system, chemotaxis family, sensor kinase CheA, partial [Acidimicrobiaceae bacterium]